MLALARWQDFLMNGDSASPSAAVSVKMPGAGFMLRAR
jgi:hypothetical protein